MSQSTKETLRKERAKSSANRRFNCDVGLRNDVVTNAAVENKDRLLIVGSDDSTSFFAYGNKMMC